MLQLQQVSKSFAQVAAVAAVDLQIGGGEAVALIGPSGCGKSTLLRLMVGLLQPDSGEVRLDGQRLAGPALSTLRQQLGYVIQSGGLFPHLSATANVTLMARHLRWEKSRIDSRLSELADLVRLPATALARFPHQLSGGQSQRVSLMRALMLDPRVLLLDEPLGALDPMIRRDLQVDLRSIFRRLEKTVVLVTHDLAEASYFTSRLVLMDGGRIVQQGSFEELSQNPATPFVSRFVAAQRPPGSQL